MSLSHKAYLLLCALVAVSSPLAAQHGPATQEHPPQQHNPVDSTTAQTKHKVLRTPEILLPKEPKLEVTKSRDRELELMMQRWFDGYTLYGTNRRYAMDDPTIESTMVPAVHDSVYISMLEKIPSAMRMSYNSLVREGIELYLYRRQSLLRSMLSVADLYFPQMETILDKAGLPLELKYLTIVESALNPRAVSPAGASGLWQLMLPTGKYYGLTINSLVDERFDLEKSTIAAARLLKELHDIYGDWWLALAAYNCGGGNVNRAIHRAGGGNKDFWDIYRFLPRETRRYVPLFIGAYYAMYYHKEYGIEPRDVGRVLATDYYTVKEATTFDKLSELSGVDKDLIALYNPQFKRGIIPGNTTAYPVRLPIQGILRLEGKSATMEIKSEELAVDLDSPNQISEAEQETSQTKTSKRDKRKNTHKTNKKAKSTLYKVRSGDTLGSIAKKHGISVKRLKQLNGIKGSNIRAGKSLKVS